MKATIARMAVNPAALRVSPTGMAEPRQLRVSAAALALSRSSKLVRVRNEEKPVFMRYLMMASGDKIFAEGGGQQIRDKNGEVIGAVGVTGDTEDRDEELATYGIHAVGLKTDEDCKDMGRKFRQRLTSGADGR